MNVRMPAPMLSTRAFVSRGGAVAATTRAKRTSVRGTLLACVRRHDGRERLSGGQGATGNGGGKPRASETPLRRQPGLRRDQGAALRAPHLAGALRRQAERDRELGLVPRRARSGVRHLARVE